MKKTEMTYEEAMQALETLTRKMESGEMPIDQMAENLKEAKRLAAFCRKQLLNVEEQIKEVMG